MNAEPASDVVEAFNSVLRLSGADVEALDRAAWRFQALWRRNPASVVPGLGLMIAFQLLGDRTKAVGTGAELWGRRAGMDAWERGVFASIMAALGSYDLAAELVAGGIGRDQSAWSAVQSIAVGTWDDSVPGSMLPSDAPGFQVLIAEMEQIGLLPHMRERQAAVNRIIVPHQLNAATSVGTDGGDRIILTRLVYTDLDLKENLDLALAVAEVEQSFYNQRNIEPAAASYLVTEVLLPARGQLPALRHMQVEAV